MCVDAFAVASEVRELLAHRRQFVETGLLHVPQRRPDHQIGHVKDAQDIGERRIAVQGAANIRGGACMAVKEDVLPRHQHIVEDDQCVDLVEAVGGRVIGGTGAAGKARAPKMFDPRCPHLDDAADRVARQLLVGPAGDCRF